MNPRENISQLVNFDIGYRLKVLVNMTEFGHWFVGNFILKQCNGSLSQD